MNIGSIFGGVAKLFGASSLLPGLGGLLASVLLDPLKDLFRQFIAAHVPGLPQQATDAVLDKLNNGFLAGLKG